MRACWKTAYQQWWGMADLADLGGMWERVGSSDSSPPRSRAGGLARVGWIVLFNSVHHVHLISPYWYWIDIGNWPWNDMRIRGLTNSTFSVDVIMMESEIGWVLLTFSLLNISMCTLIQLHNNTLFNFGDDLFQYIEVYEWYGKLYIFGKCLEC